MGSKQSRFIDIFKPRILYMQWVTVTMGFILAKPIAEFSWSVWGILLLGTTCVSAAGAVLNNALEHKADQHMERTRYRVLATGRFSVSLAVLMGVTLWTLGTFILWLATPLAAIIGFLTVWLMSVCTHLSSGLRG